MVKQLQRDAHHGARVFTGAAGAAGALVWKWDAFGGTSLAFSYALHVPASETLTRPLSANLTVVSGATQAVAVRPESLMIAPRLVHGADTDGDFRISLFELTRVIELYNTRRGTVRTGAYAVTTVETEDGFAADATRTLNAGQTLSRYHSADTNRDGCIALGDLLRMIELYNYRAATVRTGQYHAAAGTEDGFTPGP